jgi:predicted ArsR family transcriptional regulator
MKRSLKVNAMSQALMIRMLLEGESTCQDMADETGLHVQTIRHYCRELHIAKVIRIDHFELDTGGRRTLKVYKIGPGRDAKTKPLTPTERQAGFRARKKKHQMTMVLAGAGAFEATETGGVVFVAGTT